MGGTRLMMLPLWCRLERVSGDCRDAMTPNRPPICGVCATSPADVSRVRRSA
jgi:hypothetical protein